MVMSQPFTTVGWKGVQAPHQLWLLLLLKTESILRIWPGCTMTSSFFRDQRVLFPIFPLACFEMTDNSTITAPYWARSTTFYFYHWARALSLQLSFLLTDFCSPHTVQTSPSPIIDRNAFLCTACLTGLPGGCGMESRTGIFRSAGHPVSTSPRISEAEAIMIPILHMGKLRHWKLRKLLSHTYSF